MFVLVLLVFTEFNTSLSGESGVIMFKRGSKAGILQDANAAVEDKNDVEKDRVGDAAGPTATPADEEDHERAAAETDEALAEQPKMTNVFSWQDISFVVPITGGEQRQLLDGVPGMSLPGS